MNQMLAMRVFRCIAEAQGFSAAAERLNTTHSSVSRHLHQLESTLGVRLVNRNTRRMSLTAAGERYYAACVDILDRVDAASQAVALEHERPFGLLRISAPLVVGTLELAHWLPAFQARYPEIQIDLSCSDPLVDLVADGALPSCPASAGQGARVRGVHDAVLPRGVRRMSTTKRAPRYSMACAWLACGWCRCNAIPLILARKCIALADPQDEAESPRWSRAPRVNQL